MRILIVDEEAARGRALQKRLEAAPDMLVTGCVTSMREAAERAMHSDVVLLGRAEDRRPGRKLVRVLSVSSPHVKVLVVGVREEAWEELLPYLEAGVSGYVSAAEVARGRNGAGTDALVEKVRAAHRDEAIISPQVAALIMRRIAEIVGSSGEEPALFSQTFASGLPGLSAD